MSEPAKKLRALLTDGDEQGDLARELISAYMLNFTGGCFETTGTNDPTRIAADDLVAVTMLSIRIGRGTRRSGGIEPTSALAIEARATEIAELLSQIPSGIHLSAFDQPEFEYHLGSESPATRLWDLLRNPTVGMARVATHKLMARKRPALIPISDRLVEKQLFGSRPENWWSAMWPLVHDDQVREGVETLLPTLPLAARHLTPLRVVDVVTWMSAKRAGL